MKAISTDKAPSPALATPKNPFPGLRSFEPDEDHLFFGREAQVDQLLKLLRQTRLLTVVGTSGSGKSSLIRSGLIPSLHSGYMASAGSGWRVAIFRPGEDPIGNLAAALGQPDVLVPHDKDAEPELLDMQRNLLAATLRRGDLGLIECRRLAPIPAQDNLLVIADQFEELFRFRENLNLDDATEASAAFVKLLLEAAAQDEVPVYVALTMRSEFVGQCTEFVGFAEAINRGYFLIPRMSRQERREAIVGPVKVAGGEISPRLVTRLLNDVGEDPDQLPVLQHALMRTWDDHEARGQSDIPIDIVNYEAVGTLKRALSMHAEEAYADLDGPLQELAGRMFKSLTDTGAGGRRVRSPRQLAELCEITGASQDDLVTVIEAYRRPGRAFLMPPHGTALEADSVIDISHESLMRVWDRLRVWVDEESRSAQIYSRLAKAAERFQRGKGSLWRDPDLQVALNWQEQTQPNELWAERYDPSFVRAMKFLEASRNERDQKLRQREERRRRQFAWMRRIALVAAVAALAMAFLGIYALDRKAVAETLHVEALEGRRAAERERQVAVEQREIARLERQEAEEQRHRAEEQKQIAEEQRQRAEIQEEAAVAGRREAEKERRKAEERRREAEVQKKRAEDESLRAQREEKKARAARRKAEQEERRAEARRQQARAKAQAEQALRLPEDEKTQAVAVALEAYRRYLGAESDLGVVLPKAAYDPSLYTALFQAWSWLARDQAEESAAGWMPGLGSDMLWLAEHHEDAVRALAVKSRFLASGDDAGRVNLTWLEQADEPPKAGATLEIATGSSAIRALAWSVGGEFLAAGAQNGSVDLWRVDETTGKPGEPWVVEICAGMPDCRLRDLAFTASGTPGVPWLLSADSTGSLRGWKPASAGSLVETEKRAEVFGESDEAIVRLASSADGRTLAVAYESEIRVFQLRDSWRSAGTWKPELDRKTRLRSLALHESGASLAAGTEDGLLFFFAIDGGGIRRGDRLAAHRSPITALDFAADGDVLASASLDGSVRLWRLQGGQPEDREPISLEDHGGWVWDVALAADGERVISGGADRKLLVRATSAAALFEDLCAHSPEACARPLPAESVQ